MEEDEEIIGSTDESDYNSEEGDGDYDFADGFVVDTHETEDYHNDKSIMAMLAAFRGRVSAAAFAPEPEAKSPAKEKAQPARRSPLKRRKRPSAQVEPVSKPVKRRKVIKRKVTKKNP